jgi:preprotein translocase subunit YajC
MNFILLQASTEASPYSSYIFLGAMFLIFWLFFIRPQNKKQKEQKNFLADLDKGKEIVTTSGILGKITKIEEDIVTIEVASKVYLRITKGSISKEMTEAVYAADNKDK